MSQRLKIVYVYNAVDRRLIHKGTAPALTTIVNLGRSTISRYANYKMADSERRIYSYEPIEDFKAFESGAPRLWDNKYPSKRSGMDVDKIEKKKKPCPLCSKPVLTYKCREYCESCRKTVRNISRDNMYTDF